MKKLLSVLGVLLIASMLLTACGGEPADSSQETGDPTSEAAAPDQPAAKKSTVDPQEAASNPTAPASGALLVDLGFRPGVNGFSFENYGADTPVTNLTPVEVRRMFGDKVCANIKGDVCTLTPPAKQWMQQANEAMAGGHCEGFAALSLLMYKNIISPKTFGGNQAADLNLDGNELLQREIAYWFITQATLPAANAIVRGTPKEIVAALKQGYANGKDSETFTIGIYKPDGSGGHAVTAYGLMDKGSGIFWIMVYDNNMPKQERHIEVDTQANTWQYEASINPTVESELYTGDAETNTLEIVPSSPRLGQQVCQFCSNSTSSKGGSGLASAAPTFNQIWMEGKGRLLIISEQGKKLGYENKKFINEIPDAKYTNIKGFDSTAEDAPPIYYLPTSVNFTAILDGAELSQKEDTSDLVMIGQGFYVGVESIFLDPGEKDTLKINGDGSLISYKTDYADTPNIVVGLEEKIADFELEVQGVDVEPGAETIVTVDRSKGAMTLTSTSRKAQTFDLYISRIDDVDTETFDGEAFELNPGDKITFDFANWGGNGKSLKVIIDNGGTGADIETIDMADTK